MVNLHPILKSDLPLRPIASKFPQVPSSFKTTKLPTLQKNSGKSPCSIGKQWEITIFNRKTLEYPHIQRENTSSIRVHFPASYVSLPECTKSYHLKDGSNIGQNQLGFFPWPSNHGKGLFVSLQEEASFNHIPLNWGLRKGKNHKDPTLQRLKIYSGRCA